MGSAQTVVSIGEELFIWGGLQAQPEGGYPLLPTDAIFSLKFTPDATWRRIPASGDVPPSSQYAVAVVCNGTIYVFGGGKSGSKNNDLYTLSSTGVFVKLIPAGVAPAPRRCHSGWSFNGMLYYLGGEGPDPSTGGYLVGGQRKGTCNNQLLQLSPASNAFSLQATTGATPTPRKCFAVAQIDNMVYLSGGTDESFLNDFRQLDMKTWTWTKLNSPGPRYLHSLSPAAPNKLIMVGGRLESGGISNEVWCYDTDESDWTKDSELPEEFTEKGGGLGNHRAISLVKSKRETDLVILGGFTDKDNKKHPHHVLKFSLL
jgi:N-acetylneuraminic acid mutarotase